MGFDVRDRSGFSFDIPVALLITIVSGSLAISPLTEDSILAVVAGLPLLLFLPGYLAMFALFPSVVFHRSGTIQEPESHDRRSASEREDDVGVVEFVTLSIIGSFSLAMLVGFALNFTPWGITLPSMVVGLGSCAVVFGLLAALRRSTLAESRRSSGATVKRDRMGTKTGSTRRVMIVKSISGISLLTGAGTAVYGVAAPPRGDTYTQFALLTEEGERLVADEYPKEFDVGESQPVVVGITNDEGESTSYSVVIELQRVEDRDGELEVLERETLEQYRATVPEGNTHRERVDLQPTMTGERLRLAYYLYRGEAPDEPSAQAAYRSLHTWVTVTDE